MKKIKLERGMEFAVQGKGFVSKSIIGISKLFSLQSKAEYSHTGIILDSHGNTVEALYSGYKYSNIRKYDGLKIIIVRRVKAHNSDYSKHYALNPERLEYAIREFEKLVGRGYPYHRIPMHLIPGASKINLLGWPVCSEGNKKFNGDRLGLDLKWSGYKPYRMVYDYRLQFGGNYDLIYEGMFDKELLKEA